MTEDTDPIETREWLEALDAVSNGSVDAAYTTSGYWQGKMAAAGLFAAVPFGPDVSEYLAWLFEGDGLKLWRELYAKHNLWVTPCLVIPPEASGWFREPIESLDQLKGLKMRIPGFGGEVLMRVGGTPVNIPGAELFTALQSGTIDATEWVGPMNDLAFGLFRAAKYYYYPGWHEPGTTLEALINKKAFTALGKDLKSIVRNACKMVNQDMTTEFTAKNNAALDTLVNKHGVKLRQFSDEVVNAIGAAAGDVMAADSSPGCPLPTSTRMESLAVAFTLSVTVKVTV